jgi:hypothetical protein
MILLKTKAKNYSFNLKTFEREQALRDAWYSMSSIPAKANSRLKITTKEGDLLDLKICDITSVIFEASEYIRMTAADVR